MTKFHITIIDEVTTEKSSLAREQRKYVVRVHKQANKVAIKQAVKELYGVEAAKVNILNTHGKTRLMRRGVEMTKRPPHKRAIITLKEGQSLELTNVKSQ